jgi:hypothetical protein
MRNKNMQGLTLVEILIGLVMSTMIFLVATNLMVFLFFTDTKSKQIQMVEQAKDDLLSEFVVRVRWAEEIDFGSGYLDLDGVRYQLRDGRIYRGDDPLTPGYLVVDGFDVANYSADEDYKSLEIKVSMSYKTRSSLRDFMRVVVSQRKLEVEEG